jgi:hypothetical protein
MFWNYSVLKLLRLETLTFRNYYVTITIIISDATLSDINLVLCYVLSQYHYSLITDMTPGWIGNSLANDWSPFLNLQPPPPLTYNRPQFLA